MHSKITANPPRPCCYAGVQCEGGPKYPDTIIEGETYYIAEPYGNYVKKDIGITFLTDVGGIWHNSRVLADQFASAGYLTIVCNYAGKVRGEGKELIDTVITPKSEQERLKAINGTVQYLKVQRGCTKVGAAGFCAGAAWVINLLSDNASFEHIEAGFIAHPAGVTTQMLEGVQEPLSIACADEDQIQSQKNRIETENILKKNGWPYQMNLYSHVHHGFAVRRAVTTKAEVYAKKQAFIQAMSWFEEYLVNRE